MENQHVAAPCPGTLKGAAVGCAVAGAVLPWLGALSNTGFIPDMVLGGAGILLAVASVVCAIAALCRTSVAFGITMIFAGLLACGVAEAGTVYLMFKHDRHHQAPCSKQVRIHVGEGINATWSSEKSGGPEADQVQR